MAVPHRPGKEADCALAKWPQAGSGNQRPMLPSDRQPLNFVLDQLTDSRRFRVLTVIGDCPRKCLTLDADNLSLML